jgi:hypothetical protein
LRTTFVLLHRQFPRGRPRHCHSHTLSKAYLIRPNQSFNRTLALPAPSITATRRFGGAGQLKPSGTTGAAMTRLVPVAAFDHKHQANLAVSFLASKGFKAQLKAEDCGRTDPVLFVVTGALP